MFLNSISKTTVLLGGLAASVMATPITLLDNSSLGHYNSSLGTKLDLTNPYAGTHMFPGANISTGDPYLDIPASSPPDLSVVSAELGNWLGDPANLNSNWSGLQSIPSTWAVNTESAIVYEINLAANLENTQIRFGVDNGIFLWIDGGFQGGYLRPGGASPGEHVFNLGTLSAGTHFVQVLREDHGGATGYHVQMTGEMAAVPEPGSFALLGLGLGALWWFRARKKSGSSL